MRSPSRASVSDTRGRECRAGQSRRPRQDPCTLRAIRTRSRAAHPSRRRCQRARQWPLRTAVRAAACQVAEGPARGTRRFEVVAGEPPSGARQLQQHGWNQDEPDEDMQRHERVHTEHNRRQLDNDGIGTSNNAPTIAVSRSLPPGFTRVAARRCVSAAAARHKISSDRGPAGRRNRFDSRVGNGTQAVPASSEARAACPRALTSGTAQPPRSVVTMRAR